MRCVIQSLPMHNSKCVNDFSLSKTIKLREVEKLVHKSLRILAGPPYSYHGDKECGLLVSADLICKVRSLYVYI